MMELLQDAANRLQFSLRSRSWGRLKLRAGLPRPLSRVEERKLYGQILETAVSEGERAQVMALVDIGCRNWSYLPALLYAFPKAGITGVELDPGRRFWNLYRRGDFARSFAEDARRKGRAAQFVEGDFRTIPPTQLILTQTKKGPLALIFLFPFVSERPCLRWGLPLEHSKFLPLLQRALITAAVLKRDILILSAHQGNWEGELALKDYTHLGLTAERRVLAPELLGPAWPQDFGIELFVSRVPSCQPPAFC